MVNYRRVRDAQIECGDFVSEMRDEVHTWLAPICDCPDLQTSVARSLVGKSRELAGNRVSDDRCLIAEAALFFCHKEIISGMRERFTARSPRRSYVNE
jgi:hypothetical protein